MIVTGFGMGFFRSRYCHLLLYTISSRALEDQPTRRTRFFPFPRYDAGDYRFFGTIQTNAFTNQLKEAFKGMQGSDMSNLGDPRSIFLKRGNELRFRLLFLIKIVQSMSDSITNAFTWALIPIGAAFLVVLLMGNARIEVRKEGQETVPEGRMAGH
ncbi:hypothetical protein GCM10020331_043250 [Ectobacillus funiculus]